MDRRAFLGLGATTIGGILIPSVCGAATFKTGLVGGARRLAFRNAHTGESFSGVYRVGDKYLPDSFRQINTVLRDFRTGDTHPMDPRVIDILYMIQRSTGRSTPFEIISGYRSPKTNEMLRKSSTGVAKKSFHMQGRAIDLRMEGFSTRRLRDVAKSLQAGGVGYYSKSNFIHIDSGDVRSW
jgi:uncharacterized protein YcbK (DUF882 family)